MRHRRLIILVLLMGLARSVAQAAEPANPTPAQTNQVRTLSSEVGKMLRGHSEPQVILTFIQQWQEPFLTSTEDMVQMRQLGASPEILDAYARRGAELRLKASAAARPTNGAPQVLLYPVARPSGYMPAGDGGDQSLYIFSESLPWVSEWYGIPYHYPYYAPGWGPWWGWGGGLRHGGRRH